MSNLLDNDTGNVARDLDLLNVFRTTPAERRQRVFLEEPLLERPIMISPGAFEIPPLGEISLYEGFW